MTKKDKDGNDEADDCATKGVKSIGLTNVTKWCSIRHEAYNGLLKRIQIMIIKVLQKEKEMRAKMIEERNFVAGYDEAKFVKTEGGIKAPDLFEGPSRRLELQPPAKGNHRLAKVQKLYVDVSSFLSDQCWRLPSDETRASGTTWLELFILFDTLGYRRREGRTKKNAVSAERADRRKAKHKHQRRGIRSAETSEPRASLGEELEAFKKVVRHTTRQDGDAEQAKWFHADTKPQYRRLKVLGIMEHQPAIAANCEVDPLTMNDIEDAIIAQKARCTAKQLKQYKDARQKVQVSGAFPIRKSKIYTRSCPKWKRSEREEEENQKEVKKRLPLLFHPCVKHTPTG